LGTLVLDNTHLGWRKIYPEGDPNATGIEASEVNGTEIKPGTRYIFRSCGRVHSSSGTDGNFKLKYNNVEGKIVHWDNP
jgi:hypothetical protein